MARIPMQLLEARAKLACEAVGLSYGRHWVGNVAQVGNVALQREDGRYGLAQIVNAGGGIRTLNGDWNPLKASEMLAFIDGLLVAARHLKSGEV